MRLLQLTATPEAERISHLSHTFEAVANQTVRLRIQEAVGHYSATRDNATSSTVTLDVLCKLNIELLPSDNAAHNHFS